MKLWIVLLCLCFARSAFCDIVVGKTDSPYEIVIFTTLTCGACKKFYRDTMQSYLEGPYQVTIKHFAMDEKSLKGAIAVECMPENSKYAYYKKLFVLQENLIQSDNTDDFLINVAVSEFSANAQQLRACMNQGDVKNQILQQQSTYSDLIEATPEFFFGGKTIPLDKRGKASGAITSEEFEQFLKDNLQ